MDNSLMEKFIATVGEKHALIDDADKQAFVEDTRGRYKGNAPVVLRPGTVEQISSILKLASETKTPIIPQGGNTGLVGGGLPLAEGDGSEVILSLGRMNKIINVDADTNTMTVEAGAILQKIQQAADDVDRLFPLSLGAQGTCQIGGNIGTNAGGTGVLAYGNTRDLVMGLEAVLPTGEIWDGLSQLRKDNTGYDLKNLLVGSEGTLAVVTKAVLKLFPKPKGREVAFIGLSSPENALTLLNSAKGAAGNGLTAFELMANIAMQFTVRHTQGIRAPMGLEHHWYVLMEVSSGQSTNHAREMLEGILTDALEKSLIDDATLAHSGAQQDEFWKLREEMSWAQKPEGASIKHDISIPVGSLPKFIESADKKVQKIVPGSRIVNFGHMGDGNLHYNISQPPGWNGKDFFAMEPAINDAVYELVAKFNGSLSAEHGIGQMKRDKLAKTKDPTALMMMRNIKQTLDPAGIMNPGKVL